MVMMMIMLIQLIVALQFLQEGARIQSQLTLSLTNLAKTKEKYEKAFGASEKALEAYNKADADLNLSRADVEKHRMNSNIKRQQMDDSKNEYANQLQKTNELQVSDSWSVESGIHISSYQAELVRGGADINHVKGCTSHDRPQQVKEIVSQSQLICI